MNIVLFHKKNKMGAELILYNYNTSLQDAKNDWAMTYSSLSANIIEIENGFYHSWFVSNSL